MSIIAGIDLSPTSLDAAKAAAKLAARLHEKLVLVRAIEPVSAFYPELTLMGAPDLDQAVRRANNEAVENVRLTLLGEVPEVEVEVRIVAGRPHEVLIEAARETDARLIAIGTHGRGAASRLFLGSVSQRTLREAQAPVLVLREGSAPFSAWVAGKRALRIVIGVDRSLATDAALAWVADLRRAGPCDVTLVHEYWPPAEYARLGLRGPRDLGATDPEIAAVIERELRAHLAHLGDFAPAALHVHACWGGIGGQLAREADAAEADLLIMGTRQPHGWDRLTSGSTVLATLHATTIPLLSVPARPQAGSAPSEAPLSTLSSVLVATDLSPLGNAAVPYAYGLLPKGGVGRVELCYVHERSLPARNYLFTDPDAMGPRVRRECEESLAALVPRRAREQGITSNVTVIDGGHAADEIVHAARRLGVDAIVLASHGRSGPARAPLGAVAEAVLRTSDRSVYLVRPPTK